MEIVKDLGMACDINKRYDLGPFQGSHGIGHTRMATESRVDIAHSHPFWARPFPDISVVHNRQIANYHKLRQLEPGHRFATGTTPRHRGLHRRQARRPRASRMPCAPCRTSTARSLPHLDRRRDQLRPRPVRAKPLLYTENDEIAMIASEEVAIRAVDGDATLEPRAGAGGCAGGYADGEIDSPRTRRARSARPSSGPPRTASPRSA
jgi:glutamine phosphoribosylpyrophosphate amidotransferase